MRCAMRGIGATTAVLAALTALASCGGDAPATQPYPPTRLKTDYQYLKDGYGRYVTLHGVNLSASAKLPAKVGDDVIFGVDGVSPKVHLPLLQGTPSYLGKPFPGYAVTLAEIAPFADAEMKKLRDAGFNSIRLMINWEGAEPSGRGVYDMDYIRSIRTVVQAANKVGVYVLMDMHQDMFSRFLATNYNEHPDATDDIGKFLGALFPPYTDVVRGEGAPRWVVQACLPEKDIDSPHWAQPRLLANMDLPALCDVLDVYRLITGKDLLDGLAGEVVRGTCVDPVGQKDAFCETIASYSELPPCGTGVTGLCNSLPGWAAGVTGYICDPAHETWPMTESSGMLPFFPWGAALATSLEVNRCYACMFAGAKVFPSQTAPVCDDDPCDGATPPAECADPCRPPRTPTPVASCPAEKVKQVQVQAYVQDAYARMWQQVTCQVKDLPNVAGYDIMNEPSSAMYYLIAASVFASTGLTDEARSVLVSLLGKDEGTLFHKVLTGLRLFPPIPSKVLADGVTPNPDYDAGKAAVLAEWGLDKVDFLGAVGLLSGFDWNFMRPFHEKTGQAIQAVDPEAVLYLEGAMGGTGFSLSGTASLTRPEGLKEIVYAPHFYPDIMPWLSFGFRPRCYEKDEVRWRDYTDNLKANMSTASWSLGHAPVVFGEFGVWFNFCGYEDDPDQRALGLSFSHQFLDSMYEGFESLGLSRMQWSYAPDTDAEYGEWYDHEDFSIQGPDRKWRGEQAWSRPYARALAGKPVATHFWSRFHDYDPQHHSGVVDPEREFVVTYERKETGAPTEIVVPDAQYGDGFFVWLSDGRAAFDPESRVLYHYPEAEAPGTVHSVRLLPPLEGNPPTGWQYFFHGTQVIAGD